MLNLVFSIHRKPIPLTRIGRKIALKNDSGSNLAQLIIGNEVEGLNNTSMLENLTKMVFRVELETLTMLPPNLSTG